MGLRLRGTVTDASGRATTPICCSLGALDNGQLLVPACSLCRAARRGGHVTCVVRAWERAGANSWVASVLRSQVLWSTALWCQTSNSHADFLSPEVLPSESICHGTTRAQVLFLWRQSLRECHADLSPSRRGHKIPKFLGTSLPHESILLYGMGWPRHVTCGVNSTKVKPNTQMNRTNEDNVKAMG